MRKLTLAALSGAAGLVIAGGAVLPALADDATTDDPTTTDDATSESRTLTDRLTRLKEVLAGLVSDGTVSQEQADTVAETLDESDLFRHGGPGGPGGPGDEMRGGPGGPGGMMGGGAELDVAADVLGMEADVLRDLLREGGTLADIAADQDVEVSELVDSLLAAATERIDAAVADGSIDQDRADEMKANLESRVTERVEQGMPTRGGHGGRGGPMRGVPDDNDSESPTESSLQS
ncbi:MAG: hypothetical protein ACQERF_02285 [Actinomycetota bacterium]